MVICYYSNKQEDQKMLMNTTLQIGDIVEIRFNEFLSEVVTLISQKDGYNLFSHPINSDFMLTDRFINSGDITITILDDNF